MADMRFRRVCLVALLEEENSKTPTVALLDTIEQMRSDLDSWERSRGDVEAPLRNRLNALRRMLEQEIILG